MIDKREGTKRSPVPTSPAPFKQQDREPQKREQFPSQRPAKNGRVTD
jgi:hypothetical protein